MKEAGNEVEFWERSYSQLSRANEESESSSVWNPNLTQYINIYPKRSGTEKTAVILLIFSTEKKRIIDGLVGEIMNIFRLAGDMTHLLSIVVLLLKIRTMKSCAGILNFNLYIIIFSLFNQIVAFISVVWLLGIQCFCVFGWWVIKNWCLVEE